MISDRRGFRCRKTTFDDHSLCKNEINVVCQYILKFLPFSNFCGDNLYKMIEGFFRRIKNDIFVCVRSPSTCGHTS